MKRGWHDGFDTVVRRGSYFDEASLVLFGWTLFFLPLGQVWNEIVLLIVLLEAVYLFFVRLGKNVFNRYWLIGGVVLVLSLLTSERGFDSQQVLVLIGGGLVVPLVLALVSRIGLVRIGVLVLLVLLWQMQWGVAQFVLQQDLGLQRFGESVLGPTVPGVAKFLVNGEKVVRSYGPYQHANVYGGMGVVGLLLAMSLRAPLGRSFGTITWLLLLGVGLSFSRAAWLGAGWVLLLWSWRGGGDRMHWRRVVGPVLLLALLLVPLTWYRLTDPEDAGFSERYIGAGWARLVWVDEGQWNGVGVGMYPEALQSALDLRELEYAPWQIDYVHSVPILVLTEWGIVGFSWLWLGAGYLLAQYRAQILPLLALVPALLFDHYLLTQHVPLVLFLMGCLLVLLMSQCQMRQRELPTQVDQRN